MKLYCHEWSIRDSLIIACSPLMGKIMHFGYCTSRILHTQATPDLRTEGDDDARKIYYRACGR
nr:MAG TPA: hypothetical protein [Caudoviricetes sp.]